MHIQKLYYVLGGHKGSFLQRKWSDYITEVNAKRKRRLLQSVGVEALDAMQETCREAGVKFSIEFGTLLGAYRENGFIPFDDDIDVSMLPEDCSRDFENALLKHGFYKKRAFYLVEKDNDKTTRTLTEISLDYKGLTFDIFLTFPRQNEHRSIYVYCEPVVDGKLTVREFILPRSREILEITLKGRKYNVFSDPKETLETLYGKDFMTPLKNANATKNAHSHVIVHDIHDCYGDGFVLE